MPDDTQQQVTIQDVQMRAATDPGFRERLLADPAAALTEAGVDLPAGVTVAVHEATDARVPMVVPPSVDDEERRVALTGELVRLRAAVDPAFRARLLADPREALRESGATVPDAVELVPVEGRADRLDLVLAPVLDVEGELSDDALAGIDGGYYGPPMWQLTQGMPSPFDPA